MSRANDRRRNWHGSGWIPRVIRLSIYLRDGFACVWCGRGIEIEGVSLSLDHALPEVLGGGHDHSNLLTACCACNSRRGRRGLIEFADTVGDFFDLEPRMILAKIELMLKRELPIAQARELMSARGKDAFKGIRITIQTQPNQKERQS